MIGEGEYNLDALKEIEVTDSYLGMDQDIRHCQTEESLFSCTTRHYIDTLLGQCGCLPFDIRNSQVVKKCRGKKLIVSYFRTHFAPQSSILTV